VGCGCAGGQAGAGGQGNLRQLGAQFWGRWSPDSKWIAYHRDLDNQLDAIFLYSLETHKSTQVTDGMSDASSPAFDPNGKYLYFLASTDDGPSKAGIDLSSLDRAQPPPPTWWCWPRTALLPCLRRATTRRSRTRPRRTPTKRTPTRKDEAAKDAGKDKKDGDKDKDKKDADKPVEVKVDLEKIGDRILALPIPARNYGGIAVGKTGVLYLAETALWPLQQRGTAVRHSRHLAVHAGKAQARDGAQRSGRLHRLVRWVQGSLRAQGRLDHRPGRRPEARQRRSRQAAEPGGLETVIDPRAEWRQMYHETWRIERDFLYDPHTHGLNIPKIEAKYKPYLDGLASRSEFSYLSIEMLGEITIGHMFIVGAPTTRTRAQDRPAGRRLQDGERPLPHRQNSGRAELDPGLASPLTLPGVYVKEGEYLLAVNGRELHAGDNLYEFFDGTAGKQTVLHVGANADGKDARDVTVVPIGDEDGLRNLDWIEGNRRKVSELSGGKVAYVYMPNTGGSGYTNFNRYFYSQLDKQGLVLDERYNEGGFIADYVVDTLKRTPLSGAIERDGKPMHDPVGAIFGPKVMLINQNSGSGGDAMPWYFKKAGIGKLVGTRTWGGLVGIGGLSALIDGGGVTAPRYAIYGLNGDWEVENHGIAPDVAVEDLPKDVAAGHDRQLETGVQMVLDELKAHPVPEIPVPPYPNYHKIPCFDRNPRPHLYRRSRRQRRCLQRKQVIAQILARMRHHRHPRPLFQQLYSQHDLIVTDRRRK
jgi:tricorn protease